MIFYVIYGKSFGGSPKVPTTRKDMPEFLQKNCKCIKEWVHIPQVKKETEPYLLRETQTK